MARQQSALDPQHVVPLFVYTYELLYDDADADHDQIFAAMNRAMREADATALAFWRPLVWAVDRGLRALPRVAGKLYRGINVQFNSSVYAHGQTVRWPSFTSASQTKARLLRPPPALGLPGRGGGESGLRLKGGGQGSITIAVHRRRRGGTSPDLIPRPCAKPPPRTPPPRPK